jgi:hypothetical protein
LFYIRSAAIDSDPVSGGTAEKFVDRYAKRLAFDVPESLVNAAQHSGQNRTATIKRVAVDGLPVMNDPARVLADEIGFDLFGTRGTRFALVFEHLAPADDSGVSGYLDKDPAISKNKRFEFGDSDRFSTRDYRTPAFIRLYCPACFEQARQTRCGSRPGDKPSTRDPLSVRRILRWDTPGYDGVTCLRRM